MASGIFFSIGILVVGLEVTDAYNFLSGGNPIKTTDSLVFLYPHVTRDALNAIENYLTDDRPIRL